MDKTIRDSNLITLFYVLETTVKDGYWYSKILFKVDHCVSHKVMYVKNKKLKDTIYIKSIFFKLNIYAKLCSNNIK